MGNNSRENLSAVERFNPESGRWEDIPPMNSRRFGAAGAAVGGCFYMAGGNDGGGRLNTAERLVLGSAPRWEALPTMRVQRFGSVAASLAGCFVMCGGEDLSTVEKFDPEF